MVTLDSISKQTKIYIAGHQGMVGSAIWRRLKNLGFDNLIGWNSKELDLRNRDATLKEIVYSGPEVIFFAAGKVGGVKANQSKPVEFINENIKIQTNMFEAALEANVNKLVFLGSSCIYPKLAPQPISEDSLLLGPLEATTEPYGIAKISGIIQLQAYRREYRKNWISVIPPNLYGPRDKFDFETSHVIPALIRKFYEAKRNSSQNVTLWGTGNARREFLHADDLAEACLFLLTNYDEPAPINVGTGKEITIKDLAELIAEIVGYDGEMKWDKTNPEGVSRKVLDVKRIFNLGWMPKIDLKRGLEETITWYIEQQAH